MRRLQRKSLLASAAARCRNDIDTQSCHIYLSGLKAHRLVPCLWQWIRSMANSFHNCGRGGRAELPPTVFSALVVFPSLGGLRKQRLPQIAKESPSPSKVLAR